MSEQYDPDHHISFSFTDTWDTPVNLKASIVMEWCKYKEIAEQLQKRIDELEAQLCWRPVSEGNLPATNVKVEKTKQCRSCHGTGTAWLMGSIHGEDVCEKCGGVGWIEVKG